MDNLIQIAASIITLLTAAFLVNSIIKPVYKNIRAGIKSLNLFLVDWTGEEERPGRRAVPGVMERLNNIDGQLKNNGGGSLKDAVDRIECRVNRIDQRLNNGDQEFMDLHSEINRLKIARGEIIPDTDSMPEQ